MATEQMSPFDEAFLEEIRSRGGDEEEEEEDKQLVTSVSTQVGRVQQSLFSNAVTYEGKYLDNMFHGDGVVNFVNGHKYSGTFVVCALHFPIRFLLHLSLFLSPPPPTPSSSSSSRAFSLLALRLVKIVLSHYFTSAH